MTLTEIDSACNRAFSAVSENVSFDKSTECRIMSRCFQFFSVLFQSWVNIRMISLWGAKDNELTTKADQSSAASLKTESKLSDSQLPGCRHRLAVFISEISRNPR